MSAILTTHKTRSMRTVLRFLARWRLLWIILLSSLLLSGCVQYQAGINFDSPNHGEIVQHIKLGDRLMTFSGDSATEWLNSIERRARKLDGKVKRISSEELTVTIPFNNGAELESKFNEFFHPAAKTNTEVAQPSEIPVVNSQLKLSQNNFIFLLRNRLIYELDLRSLSLVSTNGNVLVNPNEILDLEFRLNTPWGARSVETDENAVPPEIAEKQLIWTLKPGELNHLEAIFWLPNPLGIGSFIIILFITAGIYLRYNFMPDPTLSSPKTVVPES
ncbi:DUF3153 domain-containing protein [Gloeocapsopsis dulcis]|uniref:DUF3153 domain-containing protein n=1 Tax=Gloeocapsopsis dulcis AAB1 = 1H9 TaxID=1433147 RepID=A0A6N8FZN0_9CHRO|nr:DUF3153 domain-containing protein [Gloeocapsopsis dulcis]MUL38588.1 hypothetical protein [Gloeocapsopsis dulcis AAB1 = 1H9]WNN91148.1 DUF3153 domain-containing protein [Gloeocapsopsis dulcis]